MYLFDTNIFLELLLDQPQALPCQRALGLPDEDHQGWVTSFSLHAIESLMGHGKLVSKLSIFLSALAYHPFLHVYSTTLEEEQVVTHLIKEIRLDFDDTLQYFVAKKKKLTLITLDKDFKRVRDIAIIHPSNLK